VHKNTYDGGTYDCCTLVIDKFLTPFSIRLTGDIDYITNAHNLAMVALTSRMQHERNYDDARLAKSNITKRFDIDPERVQMKWVMDFCAQALRNITIGKGGTGKTSIVASFAGLVKTAVLADCDVDAPNKGERREKLKF